MTVLLRLARRVLVLALLTVILVVAWLSSDAASDPLGLGITAFLIYIVVAGVWGIVDGARASLGPSLLVWLLVGVVMGALFPLFSAVEARSTAGLAEDLAGTVPFFTVLIFVPAAVGVGLGAVIRKLRGIGG